MATARFARLFKRRKGKKKGSLSSGKELSKDTQQYIARLLEDIRDGKKTAVRPKDF